MAGNADRPKRRGRPPKLRAETEEAAELVEFLRKLTSGVTVREVVERVPPYKRTQWARFLNGSELIPRYLLEQLVHELVPEPRLRQLRLEQGLELLDQAERAAAGKLSALEMGLPERELRRRLEQAQRSMIDAQQQLLNMTRLVSGLVLLTVSLQRRCADLERRQPPAPGAELVQYEKRLRTAEANLAAARDRQQEAESLRVAALQRAERYRQALEQEQDASAEALDAGIESFHDQEPTLEEYDALLEQSSARLDETGRAFDALRRQLGIDPPDQETPSSDQRRIVRGQVQEKADEDETTTRLPAPRNSTTKAGQLESTNDPERTDEQAPGSASLLGRIVVGAAVALFAGGLIVGLIGVLVVAIADAVVNTERRNMTPAWVVSGATPSQMSAPRSKNRQYSSKALVYRISSGQSVGSTFALPHMKQTWSRRIFHSGPGYVFDGYIDFQPDKACASAARLTWRLHDRSGRLPLTHEVDFYELGLPAGQVTFTARLDAPSPCTGSLRLINPEVANNASMGGKGTPPPEVATEPK
ncbi:hypothetical protein [Spirillospora sp. CA-128828]|uniref:hypothetical protein n=1 Tax=Spirillospora sp. CA-128828 TaxID=3240033 RepID=UPI003D91A0FD